MDDTNELRFRNGELTAEVRMLNSRLTDANNANAYLLNQVSRRAIDQHVKDIACLERQHKQALRENIQLKAHLGGTRQRSALSSFTSKKGAFTLKAKRDSLTTMTTEDSADYLTEEEEEEFLFAPHSRKLQLQEESVSIVDSLISLVDLSEHQVLVPQPAVQEMVAEPALKEPERPGEIGYGLANLTQRTPRPIWEQHQYPDEPKDDPTAPWDGHVDHLSNGFPLRQPDDTICQVPLPFSQAEIDRYNYGGPEFTDTEHNRLSGNAIFIEAMEGRALRQYWVDRARTCPKHTAREWREYYEEVIRPAHLEKMKLRSEAYPEVSFDSSRGITPTSTEASKTIETQAGAQEKQEQVTTEGTKVAEIVEVVKVAKEASPSAVAAGQDKLRAVAAAEMKIAVQEVAPSADFDNFEVVSQVSKPPDLITVPRLEEVQPAINNTPKLAEEDVLIKTIEPSQASTTDDEVAVILEPLPGLPDFPPHACNRRSSAFQQVASGNHPGQQSDNEQQKGVPRSKFMNRNIIPTFENISDVTTRAPCTAHQTRGDRPRQKAYPRQETSPRGHLSSQQFGPDCIEDLFAKPALFHADPLAFRSVIMTIPPTTNLSTALSKIRFPGATLFSSTYLETSQMNLTTPSTTNHILLIFLSGTVAQKFIKQQSLSPVQHFCSTTNLQISSTTTLLPTATRPIPVHIQREILSHNLTRVLSISCPDGIGRPPMPLTPEAAWRALVHSGLGDVKVPLHFWQDAQNGKIYLEFASMKESKTAWETMKRLEYYFGGTTLFAFSTDPCDQVEGEEVVIVEDGSLNVQADNMSCNGDHADDVEKTEEDAEIAELGAIEEREGLASSVGDISSPIIKIVGMEENCSTSEEASEEGASIEDAKSFGCEIATRKDDEGEIKVGNMMGDHGDITVDREAQGREMEAIAREMEG